MLGGLGMGFGERGWKWNGSMGVVVKYCTIWNRQYIQASCPPVDANLATEDIVVSVVCSGDGGDAEKCLHLWVRGICRAEAWYPVVGQAQHGSRVPDKTLFLSCEKLILLQHGHSTIGQTLSGMVASLDDE